MASTLHEIIQRYPDVISKSVDLAFQITSETGEKYRIGFPDPALQKFITLKRYISPKLALLKLADIRPSLAFIVGVDGEYPIRKEPVELSIEVVGSTKLARAYLMTEKDYDTLREAELYLKGNEPEMYAAFIRHYLQIPAYLTKTVVLLASLLTIQIFTSGTSTYIDPETKLGFEISYLSQIPAINRPLALTGIALWSALTTASPLNNLATHLNNYYSGCYKFPEAIVMSSLIADMMLAAEDTKLKIASMKGTLYDATAVTNMARPSIDDIRQWLAQNVTSASRNYAIPDFIISDGVYFTENPNDISKLVEGKYIPTDSYFFFNSGIVEGAFVPTATNDYKSEFAIVSEWLSRAPRREKVSIDTRFMALCTDPRYLGWRKVA